MGTYKQSIFSSENGYVIGLMRVKDTDMESMKDYINKTITFTGYFHELTEQDNYYFFGQETVHPKYGFQFVVERYERVKPEDKDGIVEFLSSDLFKGVGEKLAQSIVNTLGESALDKILDDKSNLLLVPKMTMKKADSIYETLMKYEESHKMIVYLTELGFSMRDALLIYNTYKGNTTMILEHNIYRVIDDIEEITFPKIDAIVKRKELSIDQDLRIKACILYVMRDLTFKNGDTYLNLGEIVEATCYYIGYDVGEKLVEELLCELNGEMKVEILDNRYYLEEIYEAQYSVIDRVSRLLSKDKKVYKDFQKELSALEKESGITYNDKQKDAIKKALTNNIVIITGGPGTGKTTIIKALIDIYKLNGKKVVLCAPTGRAAKRMSEQSGEEAKTIHRLLDIGKIEDNKLENIDIDFTPIDADVIVIDEMSMVDVFLMNYITKAIYMGTKLVLVGDSNQLPAVGPGSVLRDLIESAKVPTTNLDKIFRQAAQSKIVLNAHNVNKGERFITKEESAEQNTKDDFFFIKAKMQERILLELVSLTTGRLQNFGNYDFFQNMQVLTPTKKGMLGTKELNRILQEEINKEADFKNEKKYGDVIFREGDRVMQIKNNYDIFWDKETDGRYENSTGVFNGEIGRIERIDLSDKQMKVVFDDGKNVWYQFSELDQLELAYAITIHKSQGSEFDVVIIVIPQAAPMLLTRNLLYTAITRAKKLLIVLGEEKLVEFMIQNIDSRQRNTGLKHQIISSLNQ